MELRVLKYFLTAAREENIIKAAQLLHVTQPTLSRQIAQLEEELGVKLFRRSNHNIILTEDEMILKRRAQEILSLAEKTKRDFLYEDNELAGEVIIGSGEFKTTKFLSDKPYRGGSMANAYWVPAGLMGVPQAVLRAGQTKADASHR